MAAKNRRLMPDLDELQYKRGQTKSAIKGVDAAVRQLKEIDLMSYHVQRPIGRTFTVVANIVVSPSTCIHGRVLL